MATKKEEISNPNSCLNKAVDDDPLFVLRAQDELAPAVVRHWVTLARAMKVPYEKTRDVDHLISAMENWPGRKLSD